MVLVSVTFKKTVAHLLIAVRGAPLPDDVEGFDPAPA